MTPAMQIVMEITEEGGEIRLEDGRLKFQGVPARLIPHIRAHRTKLLELLDPNRPQSFVPPLPSEQCADDYAMAERQAIQAESMESATAPITMQPAPAMTPQRVSCGSCARFQPGPEQLSIGRCLATVDGLPPKEQRGYGAAYPMAPRHCPEFSGVAS